MSIAENLDRVRATLRDAAVAAGRPVESVRLVAVSKLQPVASILEAVAAGQVDFGENYAQELRDKAETVTAPVRWHFIGSLQRNKVKHVVGRATLVHDVDSLALAEEIGKRSGPTPTGVLLGVNIGEEPQKSGVLPADALALAESVARLPGVTLRGLMCIPPAVEDPDAAGPYFAALADLAARGRAAGLPLDELSMGMSHDYAVAIRHGATLVRVGTAIFGARPPKTAAPA
ncbi:MAG: YggS family pyridoxal phosphate-dependent enzyme [Pseudomonadota bacterium]|nr:YggS family pyridoxal phosphate-dependent enzyme [Pseudomonadota bacterium]